MIGRWRSLLRPGEAEPPRSPRPAEAVGGWMLGTSCALLCLWLGDLGTHSLIPGVLVCGALAIVGWRHIEWLFWLPTMVVVATLSEPIAPLAARGRAGALVYVDVLMLGVLLVAVVRALAFRRRIFPRTPVDLLLVLVLATAAMAAWAGRHPDGWIPFKNLMVAVLVFYASAAVAGRPGGARWIWPAFPLALAALGFTALVAAAGGAAALRADTRAADAVWHSHEGLLVTLLVALPVALGLSMDAGQRMARRLWQAAAVLGATGIGLHVWAGGGASARPAVPTLWDVPTLVLAWIVLAVIARRAWGLAARRPAETPRWVAVAFTCLAMPLLPLLGMPATGATGRFLVAIAGGLVVGTERALARDARRAGTAGAPHEPAVLAEAA